MTRNLVGGLALIGVLGIGAAALANGIGSADAAIKYRKDAMASVGGHIRALVANLKGEVNDSEGLKVHAAALSAAANASLLKTSFGQNTDGQGTVETTATGKIWEDWDGFAEQLDILERTSAEIAAIAANGELTEFDQLKPVLATCGACHRKLGYREQ
jgi:cytochrome c556